MKIEYESKSQGQNVRGTEILSANIVMQPIKTKETKCGLFQKIFKGNKVLGVSQYLHLRLKDGTVIKEPSRIAEIRETNTNCILFIMEDDSRYALIFQH